MAWYRCRSWAPNVTTPKDDHRLGCLLAIGFSAGVWLLIGLLVSMTGGQGL